MNELTNIGYLKDVFRHYNLKPKDYLGQNFLVDEIVLQDIVNAGDIKKTDTVVEVGPGLGILTQQLAAKAGEVIAVEKDRTLLPILKANIKDHKNVTIHQQDILKFNLSENVKGPYKVVANIPYYLTSHLFQYLLAQKNKPTLMVLMVQKEVGERVTAKPGDLSVLGISIQIFSDPEIVGFVPKKSFWPIPKIDSVILRITPALKFPEIKDNKEFFRIVKIGFAAKRKQLHNNFVSGLKKSSQEIKSWLNQNKIDEKARAQDLSIEDWIKLYRSLPK
jgi:16S rRNA (adenine1518-N6/adenine1519-N6)-dimethyltransferase